jgi:hypothetical protein
LRHYLVASPALASGNFKVRSTTGDITEVSADEITKAYQQVQESTETNIRVENNDGTISLLNPAVRYAGKLVGIQGANGTNQESQENLIGACKAFKLGSFTSVESTWSYRSYPVLFTANGVVSGRSNYDQSIVAKSITCQKN